MYARAVIALNWRMWPYVFFPLWLAGPPPAPAPLQNFITSNQPNPETAPYPEIQLVSSAIVPGGPWGAGESFLERKSGDLFHGLLIPFRNLPHRG